MGGVFTANLIAFEVMPWLTGATIHGLLDGFNNPYNWLFFGSCPFVVLCRNRRMNLAMLVLLLIYYCVVAFPLWLWD